MAITLSTSTAVEVGASTSTQTLTLTIPSTGTDKLLLAFASAEDVSGTASISGLTYAGSSMTIVATSTNQNGVNYSGIFYMLRPATGANTMAIVWSTTMVECKCISVCLDSVEQTTPKNVNILINSVGTTGTSLTLTPTSSDTWVFNVAQDDSGSSLIATSGTAQVLVSNLTGNAFTYAVGYTTQVGAPASLTLGWTTSNPSAVDGFIQQAFSVAPSLPYGKINAAQYWGGA